MIAHASIILSGRAASLAETAPPPPLVSEPVGIIAILLGVLAVIFYLSSHKVTAGFFRIVPALLFCYFVPTLLTTLGVLPDESAVYTWIKHFILPASLMLLILALDVPAIMRLGPKAIIMLLAGTLGVVIGGPIALLITGAWLPPDAWQGMTALCGSWIGGGANFLALGQMARASDDMINLMVVPDVFCASIWMGILLYAAQREEKIDAATGANAGAIRDLEHRLTDFQERVMRIPKLGELLAILAIGFGGCWLAHAGGQEVHAYLVKLNPKIQNYVGASTWMYILITSIGVILSFTKLRDLEGAGASKIGSVCLYLLVACIGAGADFHKVLQAPAFFVMGFIWITVHVTVLLTVAWLIRAPIFFVAVGSQANIGGAASAPVVAGAFHPSLAPVGALLAVAGYVLGTYAGILCMWMLMWVAGATTPA